VPATLAVIGDVHAEWGRLKLVLRRIAAEKVDGILLVGDIACAHHAPPNSLRRTRYLMNVDGVLREVRSLDVPVRWVPGNHDIPSPPFEGNLDHRVEEVAGYRVAGIGGAGPDRFGFPYEWSDEELAARVIPEADVYLAHAPPKDTALDVVLSGDHVGSASIRALALSRRGVLLCGHIHEAAGVIRLGEMVCMNAGGLGAPCGKPQVGFVRGPEQVWHEDLETGKISAL
jgi:Icc-related predicted phosphoesterase